jgi:WD40 repeat protein
MDEETPMPLLRRPEPPTEALVRGKARLLAQLSVIAAETDALDPGTATLPPEDPARGSFSPFEPSDDERYAFGEVFAAGGLGVVRRGEDRRLGRPVAIKELLRDSPQAARRFALEAAITARLQHPSIVPLYDLGWQGEGKPYYCMKLVDGENLEAKIAEAGGLVERLRLVEHVIDVADAIAYAHEQHIIHRDIKPANVLVGRFGETVVIDWGLAKDLSGAILTELEPGPNTELGQEAELGDTDMTEAGTVLGTLRYMSPEQARGEDVDARSDIYSLGALLYHVLAGEPPYAGSERDELIDRVLRGDATTLAALEASIPVELAAVAERAMAVEPARRYATVADFAEDLRRFQAGRMVSAHAYSPLDVARRWISRHRVLVGASALAVLGIGGVGLFALQKVRAEQRAVEAARAEAELEARRAQRVEFEGSVLDEARRAVEVLNLAQTAGRELEALARGVELVDAHGTDYAGVPEPVYDGLSVALAGLIPVARLDSPDRRVFSVGALSPDGSLLVTLPWSSADEESELELWSTREGRKLSSITASLAYPMDPSAATAFSPDNRLLATSEQTRCVIFEVETGATLRVLPDCAEPSFSVDGGSLFAKVPGGEEAGVQLYQALRAWDVETWTPRWTTVLAGKNFTTLVHPDGERLIVRHDETVEEAIALLDTASGSQRALLARDQPGRREYWERSPGFTRPDNLALSPDGAMLAVAETSVGGHVVVWNLDSAGATVLGLDGGIARSPMFSASDHRLYVGGPSLEVWDLPRNQRYASLPEPAQLVRAGSGVVAISDGEWIELPRGRTLQAAPPGRLRALEASPDGELVVTVGDAGARLWSAADHLALECWSRPAGEIILAFSPTQIVTEDREEQVRVHARDGAGAPPVIAPDLGEQMFFERASERVSVVATRADDGGIDVLDLESGELRCHVPGTDSSSTNMRLDPRAETLLVVDDTGVGHLWDVERCRQRGSLALRDPNALMPATGLPGRFAANGSLVVYHRGSIVIHDREGREIRIADGCEVHDPWGEAMLSPDGRRLLSWCSSRAGEADEIRVWDVSTREVLANIDARSYSSAPVFSGDGERLIFVAGQRELAVVGVEEGRELLRIPTVDIDATYTKLRASEDGDSVEVLTTAGELVRYPTTRAGLVEAACRVLWRSELAATGPTETETCTRLRPQE